MVFSRRLSTAALGSLALVLAATAVPAQAARVTNRTTASVTLKFAVRPVLTKPLSTGDVRHPKG